MRHLERHRTERIGWLRAAVLGANDGIVSTASLVVGVAAAEPRAASVLVAGVAGLVAGAMSMAAGEYVSVSSQADTEQADLEREREELATTRKPSTTSCPDLRDARSRAELARQVAEQLMAHDALGAHARDELGISEVLRRGRCRRRWPRPQRSRWARRCRVAAACVAPSGLVISRRAARRCLPRDARRHRGARRRRAHAARRGARRRSGAPSPWRYGGVGRLFGATG